MAKCKRIRRTKTIVCRGGLDRTISILTREQQAAVDGSPDPTIDLPVLATVAAMVETTQPVETFVGTNVKRTETTMFTIGFTTAVATVDSNHTVNHNDKFFVVERVENPEEANEYLFLFCTERGDDTKVVNRA